MEGNLLSPAMEKVLKLFKTSVSASRLTGTLTATFAIYYLLTRTRTRTTTIKKPPKPNQTNINSINKVGVNKRFYAQLKYILKICIPTWRSKTFGILILHTLFLILRTYLSVIVARLDGRLVKDLVAADAQEFLRGLGYWLLIALPATYVNSMIRYLQSKLGIALRTSLTNHVHEIYMSNNTYYKAINLDSRIDSADQLITTDISKFCNALANLYSNLGKPVLDLMIFNYQLARSIGLYGMCGLMINYGVTGYIMRKVTPAFGKMVAQEAKLEGVFRMQHSRLITNAEEIGFYNGEELEKSILNKTYSNLIKHINSVYRIRIGFNMFEDFVIKYCWSAVGLVIASIPVFMPEYAGGRTKRHELEIEREKILEQNTLSSADQPSKMDKKTGSRTQGFITNKRLMINLGDAGGRILYSYKELSELAGYTHRVYNMLFVMKELSENKFVKNIDSTSKSEYLLDDITGTITYGHEGIKFDKIPIVTPFGDTTLVKDLTFSMKSGDHLMITGPNGSGKTAILRILSGLWPQFRGHLSRPNSCLDSIVYIPQRPYLSIGTLRDQIIYPHTKEDMRASNKTDQDLFDILLKVYLDYIPSREGGLDAIKEWKDVFSGGEKQRIQLARLFYHKPRFAVFDEATSAVSNDVEALLYSNAKEANITVITISHRPGLLKYHMFLLTIGEGNDGTEWKWSQVGTKEGLVGSVETEIKKLEKTLQNVDALKKRLAIINNELKLDTKIDDLKHAKRSLV